MLQAPKRRPRCVLTGVPVGPHDAVAILRTSYHRQKPRYLEPGNGDPLAAPQTLHRSVQDGAVGLAYAVMMARYLELAVAEQQTALSLRERLELIAWWESEYGVKRVRRGLCERVADADADAILTAVVATHREQADPDEIGPRYGHDGNWIREQVRWTFRLANRRGHVTASDELDVLTS